jgi:hypothetical protein
MRQEYVLLERLSPVSSSTLIQISHLPYHLLLDFLGYCRRRSRICNILVLVVHPYIHVQRNHRQKVPVVTITTGPHNDWKCTDDIIEF